MDYNPQESLEPLEHQLSFDLVGEWFFQPRVLGWDHCKNDGERWPNHRPAEMTREWCWNKVNDPQAKIE